MNPPKPDLAKWRMRVDTWENGGVVRAFDVPVKDVAALLAYAERMEKALELIATRIHDETGADWQRLAKAMEERARAALAPEASHD